MAASTLPVSDSLMNAYPLKRQTRMSETVLHWAGWSPEGRTEGAGMSRLEIKMPLVTKTQARRDPHRLSGRTSNVVVKNSTVTIAAR